MVSCVGEGNRKGREQNGREHKGRKGKRREGTKEKIFDRLCVWLTGTNEQHTQVSREGERTKREIETETETETERDIESERRE